jgi:hypothetical protein
VKDIDITKAEELIIFKFEDRETNEPVMFGQSVCLMTPDGYFLTFKSDGQLKVEKNQRYEDGSNSIARLTKWTIHDVKNITNRERVTPLNDICLKSPFGQYLQVQQNFILSANGQDLDEDCTFKIVKSTVPHLPDWLYKRPFLNHNNITN